MKVDRWSSGVTFILAGLGAVVGLSNIWRFPYVVGTNGGGAFVIVYLVCASLIIVPILIGEIMVGRRGRASMIGSMRTVAAQENASPLWKYVGWIGILAITIISMYYFVIAGWTLDYLLMALMGKFDSIGSEKSALLFSGIKADPLRLAMWHFIFLAASTFIIARGVRAGLEKAIRWLLPMLVVCLVALAFYGASLGTFSQTLHFLFDPDFSEITPKVVLLALGQAFFSIGAGVGVHMTFGAYLDQNVSIIRSSLLIAIADVGIALLAGIAIFSIVFAVGVQETEGTGLVFVALPAAFGQMDFGNIFAVIFFVSFSAAAITSALAMHEQVVSWLEEFKNIGRIKASLTAAAVFWLGGIPCILSYNVWSDLTPLSMFSAFDGMTILQIFDYISANILIPLCGLLIAIFSGWIIHQQSSEEELKIAQPWLFRLWRGLVRVVAPVAVLIIFVLNLS